MANAQQPLTFLHLSDIHFRRGESGGVYDLDADLRNELERDVVKVIQSKNLLVDGILVTGDIAFAGQKEEFDTASEWLAKLCDLAGCPREAVWTVSGNHDVDRKVIEDSETLRTYQDRLRGSSHLDDQIAAFMRDVIAQRVLFDPLSHYNNFAARFGCDFNATRPFWEQDLLLNDGSKLKLRGLNTTLISSWSDDTAANKLVLGTIQSKPTTLYGVTYLVLGHHPPQWMRDEDEVNLSLETRAHVQLFGHKHKQTLQLINNSLRIIAGAIHPNRREPEWKPRYNLISIRVIGSGADRTLNVKTYPRVWSKDDNVFTAAFDADGSDQRSNFLQLDPWYPSAQAQEVSTGKGDSDSPDRNTYHEASQQQPESSAMNRARRLAYRFYSLPYDARLEVVQRLRLIREDDEGLQGNELFTRLLQRAKEEDRLSQLWDDVQKAHADNLYTDNPFREEEPE